MSLLHAGSDFPAARSLLRLTISLNGRTLNFVDYLIWPLQQSSTFLFLGGWRTEICLSVDDVDALTSFSIQLPTSSGGPTLTANLRWLLRWLLRPPAKPSFL